MDSMTKRIHDTIELLKNTDIYGCITGSSLLESNFDDWDTPPDVDVFVFSQQALIHAVTLLMEKYGFEPGSETDKSSKGEAWKIDRSITHGMQKNFPLSTIKLRKDGVIVNITFRKYQTSVLDILSNFDMSIVMRGYDIRKHLDVDLRKIIDAPNTTAIPNPFRDQDTDMYTVMQWVRQFDRVIKYWQRGFDTRPMARFYLNAIDAVIETGAIFDTDKAVSMYDEFVEQFKEIREKISTWLKDKEEC